MISVAPGRALQTILGIVPATLTVIFAGLVALVALGLDASRRQYALDLSDRFVDLAAVLMGSPRKPVDPDRLSNTPTDDLRGRLPRGRTALVAERQLGAVPSD